MSDSAAGPNSAPTASPPTIVTPDYSVPQSWKLAMIVACIMVTLALIGIGLTTTQRQIAPKYWIGLVPVYGLLCIGTAWNRSRNTDGGKVLIVRQVFHWLVIAGAVALDFAIRGAGEETGVAAGYNALLLLALGCFLAGVHLEWLFTLVGAILLLTLIVVVKADQYLWLVVIVGVIAILLLIGWKRLAAKFARSHSA